MSIWDNYNREDVFLYLDRLRESGDINMYGAGFYLEQEFDMGRHEAREALLEWIQTFDERHPEETP